MGNTFKFIPGQKYKVVKPFTDYDSLEHPVGERWIFVETNFIPYDDGLTLHVIKEGIPCVYRLQWRMEEQAGIIDNFNDYAEICQDT